MLVVWTPIIPTAAPTTSILSHKAHTHAPACYRSNVQWLTAATALETCYLCRGAESRPGPASATATAGMLAQGRSCPEAVNAAPRNLSCAPAFRTDAHSPDVGRDASINCVADVGRPCCRSAPPDWLPLRRSSADTAVPALMAAVRCTSASASRLPRKP